MRYHALDHQQAHRARYFLKARGQPAVIAQPRAVEFLRAESHPIPGIFLVLADHFDVTGKPKELHGLEAAPVHLLGDGEHRAGSHAKRPQAQLSVTHGGIDKTNFSHAFVSLRKEVSSQRSTWQSTTPSSAEIECR